MNDLRFGPLHGVVLNKIQNNSIEFMLGYRFKVDYDRPVRAIKTQDIYKITITKVNKFKRI